MLKAKDSFANILMNQALGNYYMLDKHLGRGDKIANYTQQTMINYLMIKKMALKMLFVCAYSSDDQQAQKMLPSIVAELLTGTDCSQLTAKEIQAVPFEYIRQVCMLPAATASESEDKQNEYGQEAIVAENNRLVAVYREFLAKRYLQSLELHACIYQAI